VSRSETAAIGPEASLSVALEVADKCRADFLRALAHLNLDAAEGAMLVELLLGRPFASCGPYEIRRAVEFVRNMLHRTADLPLEAHTHG
jgi:hypothetical protein